MCIMRKKGCGRKSLENKQQRRLTLGWCGGETKPRGLAMHSKFKPPSKRVVISIFEKKSLPLIKRVLRSLCLLFNSFISWLYLIRYFDTKTMILLMTANILKENYYKACIVMTAKHCVHITIWQQASVSSLQFLAILFGAPYLPNKDPYFEFIRLSNAIGHINLYRL